MRSLYGIGVMDDIVTSVVCVRRRSDVVFLMVGPTSLVSRSVMAVRGRCLMSMRGRCDVAMWRWFLVRSRRVLQWGWNLVLVGTFMLMGRSWTMSRLSIMAMAVGWGWSRMMGRGFVVTVGRRCICRFGVGISMFSGLCCMRCFLVSSTVIVRRGSNHQTNGQNG